MRTVTISATAHCARQSPLLIVWPNAGLCEIHEIPVPRFAQLHLAFARFRHALFDGRMGLAGATGTECRPAGACSARSGPAPADCSPPGRRTLAFCCGGHAG